MKVLYFTATGNSLYVAKRLEGEMYSIPKLIKEGQYEFEDEKIGIIFPNYLLGVPNIIKEFLEKAKLKSPYIFGIMTYGKYSGGGLNQLLSITKSVDIELSYANEILMIDNYLPIYNMDKERKVEGKKKIEENIEKIINDIKSGNNYIKKNSSFNKGISFLIEKLEGKNDGNADEKFYVENACTSCKICEKVCPVDNIKVSDKPKYLHHCIKCMACIHHCPVAAIRHEKEKSKARFINQNVRLKEIIESNN